MRRAIGVRHVLRRPQDDPGPGRATEASEGAREHAPLARGIPLKLAQAFVEQPRASGGVRLRLSERRKYELSCRRSAGWTWPSARATTAAAVVTAQSKFHG